MRNQGVFDFKPDFYSSSRNSGFSISVSVGSRSKQLRAHASTFLPLCNNCAPPTRCTPLNSGLLTANRNQMSVHDVGDASQRRAPPTISAEKAEAAISPVRLSVAQPANNTTQTPAPRFWFCFRAACSQTLNFRALVVQNSSYESASAHANELLILLSG